MRTYLLISRILSSFYFFIRRRIQEGDYNTTTSIKKNISNQQNKICAVILIGHTQTTTQNIYLFITHNRRKRINFVFNN